MAERNSSMDALVLTVRRQGEQNFSVCMISAELGIFRATLYGGAKSRRRSLVQPFNCGRLYLYTDDVHHLRKITDFDVRTVHPTLRKSLYKMWAANLAGELVLRTQCAGDYGAAYTLLTAFLDGIDATDDDGARLGMLRFLWRYLALLGVQPDPCACRQCGSPLSGGGTYDGGTNGFLCGDCAGARQDGPFFLPEEALSYLEAVASKRPGESRRMPLGRESARHIKQLEFFLVEEAAGCRLRSIESGMGIL